VKRNQRYASGSRVDDDLHARSHGNGRFAEHARQFCAGHTAPPDDEVSRQGEAHRTYHVAAPDDIDALAARFADPKYWSKALKWMQEVPLG
jgi:hypothetical protein